MITEQTRDKIDRTRSYLLSSSLPEDTKDGLQSLLDAAGAAANGSGDKIASLTDAFLLLIIHEVRQAVRNPIAVEAIVKRHEAQCKMAVPAGKLGFVYQMRWPLAIVISVAFVSPNFVAIAGVIQKLFK